MGFLWLNPVESDKNNTEVTKKKKKILEECIYFEYET